MTMNISSEKNIRIISGRLHVEDLDAGDLAQRYGTPLYVCSENQIRTNYRQLHSAFYKRHKECTVLFANKANNNIAVRKILTQEGAGGDCFGLGELHFSLSSGVPPEKLVLNGSNKGDAELEVAIRHGVTVNVDHPEELATIEQLAGELGRRALVNLRVLPFSFADGESLSPDLAAIVADKSHDKWGMDRPTLSDAMRLASEMKHIQLRGLHMHVSRIRSTSEPFAIACQMLARCILELRQSYGWQPEVVDVGGGYAYARDPESGAAAGAHHVADADEYAEAIITTLKAALAEAGLPMPAVWLEPGRFLVSNATILLTRVGLVKQLPTGDATWVHVDASTNHCLRAPLQNYYYEIVHATAADHPARIAAHITGPTCTMDLIGQGRSMPSVQRGDLLGVLDVGGYAEVMATQFNLIPRPATVLVNGDRVDLIRRREDLSDLQTTQVVPARFL